MPKFLNNLLYITWFIAAPFFSGCKTTIEQAPIMLFNGTGTSPNDVEAVSHILSSNQLDFVLVNSAELNALDSTQLRKYKLIIIPGGNFIDMGKSLTVKTTGTIQHAVHNGLNYLGICAGGFLAGDTRNNSFNIAGGASFKFYSAEYNGIRKQAVAVTGTDGTVIDHYWEDGPEFSGWGAVISTYPDGKPATVKGMFGSGLVILTGVHAEAPESWRKEFVFSTSIDSSHQYAVKIIKAALKKVELR